MKEKGIEVGMVLWMSMITRIAEEIIQENPPPKNPIKKYFWKRKVINQIFSKMGEFEKEALSMLRRQRKLGQTLTYFRNLNESGSKKLLKKIVNKIIDETAKNY